MVAGGVWFSASVAQTADVSPSAKDLLSNWKEGGRKLADMAADFPESKYDFKATPEVRSFAEQLIHAAGYANYVGEVAKGLRSEEHTSELQSQFQLVCRL